MTPLLAYPRSDGKIGIRNHLFVLPAVVCANQVALDLARRHPRIKIIEHQHGCAQIGDDLAQTRRIFRNLAVHPNAYATMVIGLGCEGIMAPTLLPSKTPEGPQVDLVVIQEVGGTAAAEAELERWLTARQPEANAQGRTSVEWKDLVVALYGDDGVDPGLILQTLASFRDLGARLLVPERHKDAVETLGIPVNPISYGETGDSGARVMEEGRTPLETTTGLTAAGAHLIVHLAAELHAFGSPLAPILRWSTDPEIYEHFPDDFDGAWTGSAPRDTLISQAAEVVNGRPTVAEQMGLDDFALYRIGPTV